MGISSKKTTTKETSKNVTTPDVPDWIKNPTMQAAGNVQSLMSQGPGAYTPQISDLQNQAFQGASKLTTSPYFQQSADALNGVTSYNPQQVSADQVTGASLLDGGLDKYYNPYKNQVLNPALADFDAQAGKTRAAQAAAGARGGAFGGSRFGIQEAQTEGELARGRASTEGTLLNQMYGQATTLAEQDAARRQGASLANQGANLTAAQSNQQAGLSAAGLNQQGLLAKASQLAGLGTATGGEARANLGVQAALGGTQTDAENAIRQYPLEYQRQMEGLLGGLNGGMFTGQTQTGNSTQTQTANPGLLGGLGQLAGMASLFVNPVGVSDRRAKVGIKTLFHDWKGRRWVEFAYRWAPAVRRVGVIAQEVMRTDPACVLRGPDGVLAVDYGGLN